MTRSFAFADPPYLGCCKLYGHHHPAGDRPFDGRCWDEPETHQLLIEWLVDTFPDGWALCASAPSLRTLLPFTPDHVRIAPWVKTFCAFKKGVRPAYAWEPVLFHSRRNPPHSPHAPPVKNGEQNTPKDFYAGPITLMKGLTGAKSEDFCAWVLSLLNVLPGDNVTDVFVGTGSMTRVSQKLTKQHLLFP